MGKARVSLGSHCIQWTSQPSRTSICVSLCASVASDSSSVLVRISGVPLDLPGGDDYLDAQAIVPRGDAAGLI